MKTPIYKSFFTGVILAICCGFVGAQVERDKGIELYKQGKNKEAIAVLEKTSKKIKTDAEVWNFLGLAYFKGEDYKNAVKAFEKAVRIEEQNAIFYTNLAYAYLHNNKLDKAQSASSKGIELNPQNLNAYYIRGSANLWEGDNDSAIADANKAIAINSDFSLAYTLKSEALYLAFGNHVSSGSKAIDAVNLLQEAKEVLETCLKNCKNNLQEEIQQEKSEAIQIFYNYFSKNRDANLIQTNPVPPDPSITPLKIVSKKAPQYTDNARANGISGTIRMAVFFSDSGRVTHTLILKGLGGGLNNTAVHAARQIKFEPAKKDGKPISQIRLVEYSFSLY
jgi:TonB family protein